MPLAAPLTPLADFAHRAAVNCRPPALQRRCLLLGSLASAALAACGGGESTVVGGGAGAIAPEPVLPAATLHLLAGAVGGGGYLDGAGSAARFSGIDNVTFDPAGNAYVADGNVIRKVTPAGVVSTFAGVQFKEGSTDGAGVVARFGKLRGLTFDAVNNAIYAADPNNSTVRRITLAGLVSTLAGTTGVRGSLDGASSAAQFNVPSGIACDSTGNVYVCDLANHTIRQITPAGMVTTLAGLAGSNNETDGTGAMARFSQPFGLAYDPVKSVLYASTLANTIRAVTLTGVVTTLAGTASANGSADGTGALARFAAPRGLTCDALGNVLVADTNNHTLRSITPAGVVTTLTGSAGDAGSADGTGGAARFRNPQGVAVDRAGTVYVADAGNGTLRRVTAAGAVSTLAGLATQTGSVDDTGSRARFFMPIGLAADSAGNVYVADSENYTIRKITPLGKVTTLAGMAGESGNVDGPAADVRLGLPYGVACDAAGNVYVADFVNQAVRKITPLGTASTLAGAAANLKGPSGIACDSAGNVYVAALLNHTIHKITPGGVVSTLAGTAGIEGSSDGAGSVALFARPAGVACDNAGNIYVADSQNCVVRKINAAGLVTTLAGTAGVLGSLDGTGAAASFADVQGLACDSAGNVYAADLASSNIRKITPAGVVTTVIGVALPAQQTGVSLGTLPATLNVPSGVCVKPDGQLVICDYVENVVLVTQNFTG